MAFPQAIVDVLEMPLAVSYLDFDPKRNKVSKDAFYGAWCAVLANLYDKSRSEIEERETRRRARRRLRIGGISAGVIGGLSVALVFAVISRNEAKRQRDLAEERLKVAVSRQLAAQSRQFFDSRLDLGLLLAVEATRAKDTMEARSALLEAIESQPQLVRYLHGHNAPVTSVVFGQSDVLASGGRDGDATVRLWNLSTCKLLHPPIRAEKWRVEELAISPNGRTLASAGDSGVIRLWDIGSRQALRSIEEKPALVDRLAFRPDGALFAGGSYGAIRAWNPDTGEALTPPVQVHPETAKSSSGATMSNSIRALLFSPDGKALLSIASDGTICVSDSITLKPLREPLEAHKPAMGSAMIAFHPDGRLLASSFDEPEVRFWSWPDLKPVLTPLTIPGRNRRVLFTPGGDLLVATEDGSISQWNVKTLQRITTDIFAKQGRLWDVANRSDGLLASAGHDGTIILWNLQQDSHLSVTFPAHAEQGIGFAADGTLVTGGEDGVIRSWDVSHRAVVAELYHTSQKESYVFALSQRNLLVVGYDKGSIEWIDLATRNKASDKDAHSGMLSRLTFSLGGDRLVTAEFIGGSLRLSRSAGTFVTSRIPTEIGYSWDVAFSPEGDVIAVSGQSGSIRLFRARDLQPLSEPIKMHKMGMNFLTFTPAGRLISAGGRLPDFDNFIQVLDGKSGRPLSPPVAAPPISRLSLSDEGKILAGGGFDGSVRLWDSSTLQYIGLLKGGHGVVRHLAASPDGHRIAASYDDGTVTVFNVDLQSWQELARYLANRDLTLEERQRFLSSGQ